MPTRVVFLILILSMFPGLSRATDVRTARATRISAAPVVDGVLDDPVWRQAELITNFVQAEPYEGQPATEQTHVRILYSKDTLFIGFVCHDSAPSRIVVTDSRRDSSMDEMDSFQIILDTYHDKQNGFVFGTNPAGIEFDGQVSNEGQGGVRITETTRGSTRVQAGSGGGFNLNWDASWQVRTSRTESAWMGEFAIPFRSLRYGPQKAQVWGINFMRNIRRNREEDYWSPVSRIYDLYRLSSAGELHGLELEMPRNLKITPYVVSSAFRDHKNQRPTDYDGNLGLDLKLGLTPSLKLDATVNTDFAQVEVDEQQINLTRFNLFFPEKRPFFLENAGTFAVGKAQTADLFFSRRIGIDSSGNPVPIIGGARLSGKAEGFNIGVLNMQTGGSGAGAGNNFTVTRVNRELPNRSNLGAIFSNRTATGPAAGGDWNRTWGVDGKLGVGEHLTLNGFVARTETPLRNGPERALNARGEYQRRAGRFYLEYVEVGDDFNPEIGFLQRKNYRNVEMGAYANVRPESMPWLREWRPHMTYESFWDFSGFQESDRYHMSAPLDFASGASISPSVNVTLEGLKQRFEIGPGINVQPGSYRNTELALRANTNRSARLYAGAELDYGGFLSGNQRSFSLDGGVRKGSRLSTSVRWRRNDIDLREGDFQTDLVQWRFNCNFTPLIYLQYLIQYNNSMNTLSANVRFGVLNTAGTGFFFVYNEGRSAHGLTPLTRTFILKYTRQFDVLK